MLNRWHRPAVLRRSCASPRHHGARPLAGVATRATCDCDPACRSPGIPHRRNLTWTCIRMAANCSGKGPQSTRRWAGPDLIASSRVIHARRAPALRRRRRLPSGALLPGAYPDANTLCWAVESRTQPRRSALHRRLLIWRPCAPAAVSTDEFGTRKRMGAVRAERSGRRRGAQRARRGDAAARCCIVRC